MINNHVDISKKVFTAKQVNISAFIAGPIPPGILIFKNHMALGNEKKAYISLIATLIFTVLLFSIILNLPQSVIDKVPSFIIPSIYALIVAGYFNAYMNKEIIAALDSGSKKASNWVVAGLSILGLILNILIVIALAVSQPLYDGKLIDIDGNELYYQEPTSLENGNMLATQLKVQGFFGPDYGNIAVLNKIDDEYFITIVMDESFWSDDESMSFFRGIRSIMEIEFGSKTHLKLESFSITGDSKFKIIE